MAEDEQETPFSRRDAAVSELHGLNLGLDWQIRSRVLGGQSYSKKPRPRGPVRHAPKILHQIKIKSEMMYSVHLEVAPCDGEWEGPGGAM